MTRAEAIKYFKRHLDLYCVDGISREAEEMAIQALSQEPCDDAISRDAVQKEINCWIGSGEYRYAMSERFLIDRINNLPSVTQKSGKWQVVSDGYGDSAYICECSECKDTVWVYKNADRKWKYCPNCGAKMESEDK